MTNLNDIKFDKAEGGWVDLLTPEDRAWFEEYMPEALNMEENVAKRALEVLDIEKLRALTDNAQATLDDVDDAFTETNNEPTEQEETLDDIDHYIFHKFKDDEEDEVAPSYIDSLQEAFVEEEHEDVGSVGSEIDFSGLDNVTCDTNEELIEVEEPIELAIIGPDDIEYSRDNERYHTEWKKWTRRSHIALAIGVAALAALVALGIWLGNLYNKAANLSPDPLGNVTRIHQKFTVEDAEKELDLFPDVDWEYWQDINPDVIGWVTIPDTNINYAIVQERDWARGHYLNHDVYGNWNYCGTPYLAAECAERGLDSLVCPVAGHHMTGDDQIFAQLAQYTDIDFANEHKTILLQTPNWKKKLEVQAADIVPGWEANMYTEFSSTKAYYDWWERSYEESDVKVADHAVKATNTYLFYTCSYFVNPANERTLVYAQEMREIGNGKASEDVWATLDAEREQVELRNAAKAERLAQAKEIAEQREAEAEAAKKAEEEAKREAEEKEKESEKKEDNQSSSASSSSSGSSTSAQAQVNTSFSSIHKFGDASAHTGGTTNEWQEGYYLAGSNDVEDLAELEVGNVITLGGKRMQIEKIVANTSGDYVKNRQALGWDKTIIQVGQNLYVCNDGSKTEHTTFVFDGITYTIDPKTGETLVKAEDEDEN